MGRTRKSIQPLNLHKYDVLIEDKGTRSEYFKITQFDGYFYGGRNAFLIAGTSVLKPNSTILVEILNVNGETVYSAPVSNFIEGNSRLVQVEVYSDTPIGPGKIVVLGQANTYLDGTSVPTEWSNKYNVRWISDVVISPLINNKTPLRFVNTPVATVEEKFYPIAATASFSQSVLVEFGDYELTPVSYNTVHNGYLIKLKNPTTDNIFTSDQLGGSFETFTTLQGTPEFIYTKIPITKIFNSTLAESRGTLITSSLGTVVTKMIVSGAGFSYPTEIDPYGTVTVASSINRIRYNKLVEFNNNTVDTSFAKLRISNLNTISGEINKIRVSYKVTTEPGDFITLSDSSARIEELLATDSGSKIINLGQFNKIKLTDYWYSATTSLAKNEIDPILPNYYFSSSIDTNIQPSQSSNVLLDSIFITPEIENSTYKNYASYFIGTTNIAQISLLPNSEYTLKLNALFTNTSESIRLNQADSSVEIYLVKTETSTGTLLETNPRGQLLGILTPSSNTQLFESVEFNFKPKIIAGGTFGLRFVVYGGFWNFSNVSIKVAEETFFSPDEVTLLIPTVNRSDELLTFKTEFLDINNNSSKIIATTIPTIFTGSSDYVKKSGDYMTGELFIKGIPIQQQALQDGFTGLVSGGLITVNTPASWSYTISSGSGYVIDNYTDPLNPAYTYVTWPQITKMPSSFVTTGSVASYPRTNIAISASGEVIEQSGEWTALDYRKYIILGRIAHVGTTFIQRALSLPLTTYNRGFHWFDLANAIGILNVEGNVFYPSGSSMSIGKTAGKTYRVGSNYRNNTAFPDITTDPASLPTTFAYRFRSGSGFKEEPLSTIISGNFYDDGSGILQTVNPNKFTVQRIYYFGATNTTRIQFGQTVYDTLVDAQSSADAEIFVADPNLERDSSLRAYLIVGSSATNLSNPTDAEFITIGKFGAGGTGGGGGGGGATALSGLTDVNLSGPTSGQLLQYNGTVWINGTNVTTLATTGSNSFLGNQIITGSLTVSGSSGLTNIGTTIVSGSLIVSSSATASFRIEPNLITVSGSASFAGPIVGTHAAFSQMFNENTTTAGVYLGRNLTDNTPRVGFFNGTTAQNWQIDNSSGQFRWYTPGVTRMTLTTSGTSTVLRLLGASSVITSEGSVSASRGITGSLQGTSSFANTSSALIGGTANYIPVWSSPSAMSSSTMFQLGGNVGIGTLTPQTLLHVSGNTTFDASVLERATVSATAANGTINFDVNTQAVLYYTTNASGNWTLNIRGSSTTSLNSLLVTGQAITIVFLVTNGVTAYYPTSHTIDGVSVTPKWQGGTAITSGNSNAVDVYAYSIIKTADATFTVLASQTNFA